MNEFFTVIYGKLSLILTKNILGWNSAKNNDKIFDTSLRTLEKKIVIQLIARTLEKTFEYNPFLWLFEFGCRIWQVKMTGKTENGAKQTIKELPYGYR